MDKTVIFALLDLTRTTISGEPGLHPRVIFPMTDSEEVRREALFGDLDRQLESTPGYQDTIMSVGTFTKDWIKENEVPKGLVSELLKNTINELEKQLLERTHVIYAERIARLDRALLEVIVPSVSQAYTFVSRKKGDFFGRFSSEQGNYIDKLRNKDILGALRYSYQMTNIGYDRMRGYGVRRQALETSTIKKDDKPKVQTVMDNFVVQKEKELSFWYNRCVTLRELYDVLQQLVDGYEVLSYKERTGAKDPLGSTVPWVYYRFEQRAQNALYGELIASFRDETRLKRELGLYSWAEEFLINSLGSLYSSEIGAKGWRPYPEVLKIAQGKVQTDEATLTAYEEASPFNVERAFEFFDAIARDRWSLAKQIALNGRRIKNKDLNWEGELNTLNDYTTLLKLLFAAEDEFLKLKYGLSLMLRDPKKEPLKIQLDGSLSDQFNEVDKAEYNTQQTRIGLRMSYQKTLMGQLQGKNQGLWEKLTTNLKDHVTRYLLTSAIFEQTPTYYVYVKEVRRQISEYRDVIRKVRPLFIGSGEIISIPSGIVADRLKDETPHGVEEKKELKPPPVLGDLQFTEDYVSTKSPAPNLASSPLPKLSGSASEFGITISDLASSTILDQMALQTFTRFYNGEGFNILVKNPHFIDAKTIEAAIAFCRQNIQEGQPGWDWVSEEKDLKVFYRFIMRLDALGMPTVSGLTSPPTLIQSTSTLALSTLSWISTRVSWSSQEIETATPMPPTSIQAEPKSDQERFQQIRKILWESYKKKVDTDYGLYMRKSAETYTDAAWNRGYLLLNSLGRKVYRAYEKGSLYSLQNDAPDFRDVNFLRDLERELKFERSMFPTPSSTSYEEVEEGWLLLTEIPLGDKDTSIKEGTQLRHMGKKPDGSREKDEKPKGDEKAEDKAKKD